MEENIYELDAEMNTLIQMYLSKSLVALVTLVGFLVSVNEHV